MDTFINLLMAFLAFVSGSCVGSFLNVVIYRIPAGLSLLWPPSRCPHCLHRLGKQENVPILGWLWLRGRCRHCKAPISIRYPVVEFITGLLFVLVFWRFGLPTQTLFSWQILGYWTFVSWLLALALIDLDTMTLPNVLTRSGLVAGLAFQAGIGFWPVFSPENLVTHLTTGLFGAVLGLWLFDLITIAGSMVYGKPAMGAGDAKLAAMMGAWLGWKYLLLAGFLACLIGAFVGGGAIALGWLNRQQPFPFGPFLALGAILTALWGEAFLSAYLQLFFPTL